VALVFLEAALRFTCAYRLRDEACQEGTHGLFEYQTPAEFATMQVKNSTLTLTPV
jgi:hypothetical protein